MRLIDLVGKKFGRWTVESKSSESHKWVCVCECGTIKAVRSYILRSGESQSCGCLSAELSSVRMTRHGHSIGKIYSREYTEKLGRSYSSILKRVRKKNQSADKIWSEINCTCN